MILVDLNVLLYAVNSSAPEFEDCSSWLGRTLAAGDDTVGLAWVVILGFLRLSTSPRLFPAPLAVETASRFVDTLFEHPAVRKVYPGEGHWALLKHLVALSGTGGNLTTDAHLAALALEYDAAIATRDTDFSRFPGIRLIRPL